MIIDTLWVWLLRWFMDRRTWYRTKYLNCLYWKRFTKRRRALADHQCEQCGSRDWPLDVHHLEWAYRFLFLEWLWTRMTQVLCRSCHDKVHRLKK